MNSNLIIGASHGLHFSEAVGEFSTTREEASRDLVKINSASGNDNQLLFVLPKPAFLEVNRDASGTAIPTFGPLMDKVRQFNREPSKVIFAVGGNEHNARFLCAQGKPFDFYHPSVPEADFTKQILPAREIRATLRSLMERALTSVQLMARELPLAQKYYLPPPPPIPSDDHIRQFPEIFDFTKYAVEDPRTRLKIYRVYLEIAEAFCTANGIQFIPPPGDRQDPAGFLREAYWTGCTHATPDYYRGIVSELGL